MSIHSIRNSSHRLFTSDAFISCSTGFRISNWHGCLIRARKCSYRKSSFKSPGRDLFILNTSDGGGGGLIIMIQGRSLFNLEKTMVLVFNKELEYKLEEAKYKMLKVMQIG